MARGFDSKSVEEQQSAFAAKAPQEEARETLTPEEVAKQRKRETLILSRKQVAAQIAATTSARHRQMLEQALADLDRRIQESS